MPSRCILYYLNGGSSTETPPGSTVLDAVVQCYEYMVEENAPVHQIKNPTFINDSMIQSLGIGRVLVSEKFRIRCIT